ncbi:ABC transporter permease [Sphingobacterium sp. UGAL515B_05]|uniref:ABC transporter permease n=1 Tax=Sphingobacterium sp. UGAL515B_05 TaxID=2986767 RepID=UPI00295399AF|nr:ABC transporter permease [Sphingobacterium sp. UGAL515B_05]WON93938.1 ABC transporter permease [Sphingobacterium sp. UGAL515B_05]
MIKNNIKIAFRNLTRNKGFMTINILGLAIGMTASILIILWVNSQLYYDRMYPKTDRIGIVGSVGRNDKGVSVYFVTPEPLAEVMKLEVPEIKQTCRLSKLSGFLFTAGDQKLIAGRGAFVDATFFSIFQLPVLAGNPADALADPSAIVLTKDLAITLFGSTDVIGKNIKIDSNEIVHVSAVLKEVPSNSQFAELQYLFPWAFAAKIGYTDNNWYNSSISTFVELYPNATFTSVQQKLKDISKRHADVKSENFLKPMKESYLYNEYKNGIVAGGRIEMVRVFVLIAGFIVLIACINFMNLSTAQSERRAKEVGVRKVIGAQKSSLIWQFLSESMLLSLISGIVALILVALIIPSFGDLIGRKLALPVGEGYFWAGFLGFILLTGILAGSYPAFFLSSFRPINVLKNRFFLFKQRINPRKALVVTQFAIAVLMIVSTLVIRKQILHAQHRDAGFNTDNLIYVIENGDATKNIAMIRHDLIDKGIATAVTRTMSPMTERWSGWGGASWEGKDPNRAIVFNRQSADDKLIETTGLTLLKGRDFDLANFPTDSMSAIINESAAEIMAMKDPIGNYIMDGEDKFTIIGVVKDFIQESPFKTVTPTVIEGASRTLGTVHIKLNPKLNISDALKKTEAVFKTYNPNYPFDYHFLDQEYSRKFQDAQRTGRLVSIFAGLTIFISCLGLFGLAAYMTESRTKEIGVRKILGASLFTLTKMLSKEFIVLVGISCLIAFPIAYWAMDGYISQYSYRISIGWGVFAVTACLTLLIVLLTVSTQSIKAALANPVKSLRDE